MQVDLYNGCKSSGWLVDVTGCVVSQLTTPGVTRVVQRFIQLLVTSTV